VHRLAKYARHLPALLGLGLLVAAIWGVAHEARHLRLADIEHALAAIPQRALVLSFGFTILSYGVLTFYDRLGTIYAGHKVSYARAAFASFCAYALSHNLGFAAVSGAAVRYRLYAHWGLQPVQIAKVIAFCSLTFGLGGMVLGGAILFVEPGSVPLLGERLPHGVMYACGAGLWLIVAGYVTLSRVLGTVRMFGHEVTLPGWRMAIVQVLLATVDVALTAAIFFTLLPAAPGLTYLRFLGVYVASYTAGLAANLPGGIGVFDSAMLLGLEPYLDAPPVVGAILIFRLYYYIIPLFLAGSLFAGNEVLVRGAVLRGRVARGTAATRWSEPDFAVAAGTGAVTLCGVLLLSLSVLDPRPDFSWINPDFAVIVENAGQYVPSLIGTGLLLLALGLAQRVTLAWGSTIVLLLLGAAFTGAQGINLWIPATLVLATAVIAPFRPAYYRDARLLSGPLRAETAVPLFALIACVLALAAVRSHVRYLSANSWWQVVLSQEAPNSVRVTVFLTVVLALVAAWRLLRPSRVNWLAWGVDGRHRYTGLGATPPRRADGLVFGESGRAAIPFRRFGPVLLGLGDPVGAEVDRISAIWRLRDLAQQEALDVAFWNAGPDLLRVYADLGLTPLPLGSDGLPLPQPAVPQRSGRYLCCVAERDLRVLTPLLPALADEQLRPAVGPQPVKTRAVLGRA